MRTVSCVKIGCGRCLITCASCICCAEIGKANGYNLNEGFRVDLACKLKALLNTAKQNLKNN